MKKQIQLDLDQDRKVYVELSDSLSGETGELASGAPEYLKRSRSFAESVEVICPLVEKLTHPLQNLSFQPDETEISFSFKFNAEAEVVLTNDPSESVIQVKLNWKGKQG